MFKQMKKKILIFYLLLIIIPFVSAEVIYLDDLTIHQKAAQMVFQQKHLYMDPQVDPYVGGIISGLMNPNDSDTLENRTAAYQNYADQMQIRAFFAGDIEGGPAGPGGYSFPWKNFSHAGAIETPGEAEQLGRSIGSEMALVGYNLDFAPVADIGDDLPEFWTQTRCFGNTSAEAIPKIEAFINGLRSQGIFATMKHFPGRTLLNQENGEPCATHSHPCYHNITLDDVEPYHQIDTDFVMVSHVITTGEVDSEGIPGTVSPGTIDYLRNLFDGIIVTDSMIMGGVSSFYENNESQMYIDSIKAGLDMVLTPDPDIAWNAIEAAVQSGELTEARLDESVTKILELKGYTVINENSSGPVFIGPNMASRSDLINYFSEVVGGGRDVLAVYGAIANASDSTTAYQVGVYLGSIGLDPMRTVIKNDMQVVEQDYSDYVILALGGPCANQAAYDIRFNYKGITPSSCREGFPDDNFVFETLNKDGETHLMIAGWEAQHTLAAGDYVAGLSS